MTIWVLVILILSGPDKGEVVELGAYPSLPVCAKYAIEFNKMDIPEDPRIGFDCLKVEGTY